MRQEADSRDGVMQNETSDHVWSDWKSELSTQVLIVRYKERATKRWLISDEIKWLKGKQTTSDLLPVFESGSRISEAKLTSKSLRKGYTECTNDVWLPVEQMTSRIGARAETRSRNRIVCFIFVPHCMYGPISNVWLQTNWFWFLVPVFKTASRLLEAKVMSKSHKNESTWAWTWTRR